MHVCGHIHNCCVTIGNEAVTRNIEALLRDRDLMQMIVNADPKIEVRAGKHDCFVTMQIHRGQVFSIGV